MENRIYLSPPHIGKKEIEYVLKAFESNWIAPLGPNVDGFEQELANFVGIKSAVAMVSGTAAIHLALKACGVCEGDIVFCSSLTFSGSCNPIMYEKAVPVFIDSEYDSYNMCPMALEKAFNEYAPKAVIVVNLYGQNADMDTINEICKKHNVPVIEDAAESLGATYKGKQSGTLGKFGIFSFNGNKIITTSGGGMLISDDEEAIEKARFWSTQSRDEAPYYQHTELGYNYRMSNVLAGIGRGQLTTLNNRIERTKEIYEFYKKAFENIDDIEIYPKANWGEPNYWLSVISLKAKSKVKPSDVILKLNDKNIESRHVWKPMHMQPYYEKCGFVSLRNKNKSVAQDLFERGVCLPSGTQMSNEEQMHICELVKGLF